MTCMTITGTDLDDVELQSYYHTALSTIPTLNNDNIDRGASCTLHCTVGLEGGSSGNFFLVLLNVTILVNSVSYTHLTLPTKA